MPEGNLACPEGRPELPLGQEVNALRARICYQRFVRMDGQLGLLLGLISSVTAISLIIAYNVVFINGEHMYKIQKLF